jgi:hypothetical protein
MQFTQQNNYLQSIAWSRNFRGITDIFQQTSAFSTATVVPAKRLSAFSQLSNPQQLLPQLTAAFLTATTQPNTA